MPSFAEVLREAGKVATFRKEIEGHITDLMNDGTLITVARSGKKTYTLYEKQPEFLKNANAVLAAQQLTEQLQQPGFQGFRFEIISVQPVFVLTDAAAAQQGLDTTKMHISTSAGDGTRPGTPQDSYNVLRISW